MRNEIAFIIVSILAVAMIVFLLLMPAWDDMTALSAEIKSKTEDLADMKQTIEKMKSLQEIYDKNTEGIEKINSLVPLEADLPAVLTQVENLISGSSLSVEGVSFSHLQKTQRDSISGGAVSFSQENMFADPSDMEMGATIETADQPNQFQERQTARNCNVIEIILELKGGYEDIKEFLETMEKNMRLTDIVSLSLSPESREEAVSNFNLKLTANVYYR
jgi:Tfp pilus assembly protein PilO